jgi:dTDP-4-dehydrorhamnose 3,5-epimerase-like enzyme
MVKTSKFNQSSIADCTLIPLPKFKTNAGYITSLNNNIDLPFETQRVYYLYDIPSGETRGGHAHFELYQIIVAAMGSFDIILSDGKNEIIHTLNRPDIGLMLVPGIWRELKNFSAGSILLVLASDKFREQDYIREKVNFNNLKYGINV